MYRLMVILYIFIFPFLCVMPAYAQDNQGIYEIIGIKDDSITIKKNNLEPIEFKVEKDKLAVYKELKEGSNIIVVADKEKKLQAISKYKIVEIKDNLLVIKNEALEQIELKIKKDNLLIYKELEQGTDIIIVADKENKLQTMSDSEQHKEESKKQQKSTNSDDINERICDCIVQHIKDNQSSFGIKCKTTECSSFESKELLLTVELPELKALLKEFRKGDILEEVKYRKDTYVLQSISIKKKEVEIIDIIVTILIILVVLFMSCKMLLHENIKKLILGEDNRYSYSKFQIVLWFFVLITSYLAAICLRVYSFWDFNLWGGINIPQNLLLLSGLSALTFVAAKGITQEKVASGLNKTIGTPEFPYDLFHADDGMIDMANFQAIIITLLAVVVYTGKVFAFLQLIEAHVEVILPDVDTTILVAFGFGQGTYSAKKFFTTGELSKEGKAAKAFADISEAFAIAEIKDKDANDAEVFRISIEKEAIEAEKEAKKADKDAEDMQIKAIEAVQVAEIATNMNQSDAKEKADNASTLKKDAENARAKAIEKDIIAIAKRKIADKAHILAKGAKDTAEKAKNVAAEKAIEARKIIT